LISAYLKIRKFFEFALLLLFDGSNNSYELTNNCEKYMIVSGAGDHIVFSIDAYPIVGVFNNSRNTQWFIFGYWYWHMIERLTLMHKPTTAKHLRQTPEQKE